MIQLQQRNMQATRMNKKLRATLDILRRTAGDDTATAANDDSGNNLTDPTTSPTISWRTKNENFKRQVTEAINSTLMSQNRWSLKRKCALVAQAVWAFVGTLPELLNLSRKHFRDNVFTPFNVLKEMDLAGGTLSYEGIDIIQRVKTGGIKGFRGSMIPLKLEIKQMAGMVEWFARPICPYTVKLTSTGEAVQFDNAKVLLCILKAFHLDKIGRQRSLSVALSIDGASLSKNLSIVAAGIKVIDRAALCPLTEKPMLDNPLTMKAQSRRLNIPTYLTMGRETKDKFKEFGPFSSFLMTSLQSRPSLQNSMGLRHSKVLQPAICQQFGRVCVKEEQRKSINTRALDVLRHRNVWQLQMLLCARDGATSIRYQSLSGSCVITNQWQLQSTLSVCGPRLLS